MSLSGPGTARETTPAPGPRSCSRCYHAEHDPDATALWCRELGRLVETWWGDQCGTFRGREGRE